MRTLVAVLAAVIVGCGGGTTDGGREGLTIIGEPARHADAVIEVAAERCGRPLDGTIEWTTGPVEAEGRLWNGYCWWEQDSFRTQVWNICEPGTEWWCDATTTFLAHEIGHYCLQSSDEERVEAWAQPVNDAVHQLLTRMTPNFTWTVAGSSHAPALDRRPISTVDGP